MIGMLFSYLARWLNFIERFWIRRIAPILKFGTKFQYRSRRLKLLHLLYIYKLISI
ncbi:hypothetical protein GKC44_16620 (plasmid) [Lactobacillus parabuchneri]|uniref:Uncharacterized protein n=1 Tax=Lentilactobacillus parabuchneri TaxID=152331 RepID=A0A844EI13_9LACO|nr:hypothetical protein [Lentilactobacillus parabuchneri]MSE22815.1 hypothetical protein [Lentilactobacillus parabuchneri]